MAQQTATSQQGPWLPQQDHIKYGWGAAKNLFDVGMPGYYPGATVAGFDPSQTWAQQESLKYLGGPGVQGMMGGAQDALGRSLGGYTGFSPQQQSDLLAGNVNTGAGSPFGQMTEALTQGVQKNLGENILPGIRSGMMRSGQMGGGSRGDLVQNRAISDAVTQGLTMPMAQMYGQAYNQAQGMRMPAAQQMIGQQQFGQRQAGQTMAQPLQMYGAINAVGGARRNMTQALIDADRARYEYESMSPYQNLDRYQGATSGSWGGQGSASYPKQSKWPSIIGGIMGLGMNTLFQEITMAWATAGSTGLSFLPKVAKGLLGWGSLGALSLIHI